MMNYREIFHKKEIGLLTLPVYVIHALKIRIEINDR